MGGNLGHVVLLSFGLFLKLWIIKLALAVALFIAHTKEVSVGLSIFLSVIEKIVIFCVTFLLFLPALVAFTHNLKQPSRREKFS